MGSNMKTTEEIIELIKGWAEEESDESEKEIGSMFGAFDGCAMGYYAGYRTAEGESQQAIRELVAELEEARDDVEHCLNMDMLKRPANKPAIEASNTQLARIDALIAKYKEPNNG
jgi:hypothetical protein